MRPWIFFLCIIIAVWLLSLIRIGLIIRYNESGLLVTIRLGIIKWLLFPAPKKKNKKQRVKKPQKPISEQRAEKGGNLEQLQRYLPMISEAAGRFQKKLRIDECDLDLIWAAVDPADAAMGFGYANAMIGMLWPLIEHNFMVHKRNIRTSVDFDADKPTVSLRAAVSLRIGQGVAFGMIMGIRFLGVMKKNKKELKMKEAV